MYIIFIEPTKYIIYSIHIILSLHPPNPVPSTDTACKASKNPLSSPKKGAQEL